MRRFRDPFSPDDASTASVVRPARRGDVVDGEQAGRRTETVMMRRRPHGVRRTDAGGGGLMLQPGGRPRKLGGVMAMMMRRRRRFQTADPRRRPIRRRRRRAWVHRNASRTTGRRRLHARVIRKSAVAATN